MILILFFINQLNILSNVDKTLVRAKVKNERDELVEKAKIIYRYGKDELIAITNNKGESEFILNTGVNLLKVYKKGFYSKGYVENFKTGRKDIVVRILPKVGKIKGIISSNNNVLGNVNILLINERDEVIKAIESSNQGLYNFYNIPLFRKYYLKVMKENFLPYKSDEILLKKKKKYIRNIHLRTGETILIVEITDKNNRPMSKIFVEIDSRENETDNNGIAVFKISSNKNDILIRIREYKIEEKIQIVKGKKYSTKKIVINF